MVTMSGVSEGYSETGYHSPMKSEGIRPYINNRVAPCGLGGGSGR
jgi:hypothetical protein